jgi:hypothetical protein
LTFPDGKRYEATFKKGVPVGEGLMVNADGRVIQGRFEDGKFHGRMNR